MQKNRKKMQFACKNYSVLKIIDKMQDKMLALFYEFKKQMDMLCKENNCPAFFVSDSKKVCEECALMFLKVLQETLGNLDYVTPLEALLRL